jgi:hypothetical protein
MPSARRPPPSRTSVPGSGIAVAANVVTRVREAANVGYAVRPDSDGSGVVRLVIAISGSVRHVVLSGDDNLKQ